MRIVVERPPKGVALRVQRGKSNLLEPVKGSTFEFTMRVELETGEAPNFLGEFAQGPRDQRFIYVNSGQQAGEKDSPWDRRAKIHLSGISAALVKRALKDGLTLEVRYEGTAKDGGPSCATVPLLDGGWRAVNR